MYFFVVLWFHRTEGHGLLAPFVDDVYAFRKRSAAFATKSVVRNSCGELTTVRGWLLLGPARFGYRVIQDSFAFVRISRARRTSTF